MRRTEALEIQAIIHDGLSTLYRRCKLYAPQCHVLISGKDPQGHGKSETATYRVTLDIVRHQPRGYPTGITPQ